MPEGLPLIKDHRQVIRVFLFKYPQEDAGEAINASGRFPAAGLESAGAGSPRRQGVISPVSQAMTVKEIQDGGHKLSFGLLKKVSLLHFNPDWIDFKVRAQTGCEKPPK